MHSLGIVQWNSTRRDHLGNPGGVSGSGYVRTTSKKVARLIEMVRKICAGYQQVGIDPPLG